MSGTSEQTGDVTGTEDFRHEHALATRWGDQDAFGHVNNVAFLRYFEDARIAYFQALCSQTLDPALEAPVLVDLQCSFRQQLQHPETTRIHTRTASVGRTSFTLEQTMGAASSGALAATARTVMVWFDFRDGAPAPVPEWLRDDLRRYEAQPPEGLAPES